MTKRLLAMVDTVRMGDPFVATNARVLQGIAWALLALQLIGLVIAIIGRLVSTPAHPIDFDTGFSAERWLAVLLTSCSPGCSRKARASRDLEGTV